MMKKTLALVGLLMSISTNAAIVQDIQIQTEDSQNFTFNLAADNYLLGSDAVLTVTVQGDFNGASIENIIINLEGNNYGQFNYLHSSAYNIISYPNNSNVFRWSVDFNLSAALVGNMLSDNVLDVFVDFSDSVHAVTGFSEGGGAGQAPFAQASLSYNAQTVPIPAAAWLFGSALIGLAGIKRKK